MQKLLRWVLVGFMTLVTAAEPGAAQRVTGTVRDSTLSAPLSGAVVSTIDAQKRPIAHTITNDSGRYSIELPDSAVQLRVQRIGFQPRYVALPATRGTLVTMDARLARIPTLLSAVSVSNQRVCSGERDNREALSLWEQARAGLLVAVVARDALPADATTMTWERVIDVGSGRTIKLTDSIRTGRTGRPFLAANEPSLLAERGYVENTPAGQLFKAPDADVLLDDSFAATHCFNVRQADNTHLGVIGLAFEPAPGGTAPIDVRGTLWMEVGVPALRTLEFVYTGARGTLARAGAGGTIHFQAMPNGVAFIDEWTLTLPVVDKDRPVDRTGALRFSQRSETGGNVLAATWPDGRQWVSTLEPVSAVVTQRGSTVAFPNVNVELEATHVPRVTDDSGRAALFPVVPGKYVLRAIDTTLATFLDPRVEQHEVEVVAGRASDIRLELPTLQQTLRAACKDTADYANTTTLVGRLEDNAGFAKIPDDTWVLAVWRMRGSEDMRETQTVSVDPLGRFSVCGIARGRVISLGISRNRNPFADRLLTVSDSSVVSLMEWKIDVASLEKVKPPVMATLRGKVTNSRDSTAIAGADVWFPELDRHATTDANGSFFFDTLPPRLALLQIRSVGFLPERDTLTLIGGSATVHNYTLFDRATHLDAVNTVATRVSANLKGFEERQTHHASGYFIPDSTLRRYDGQALTNIILGRTAGLQLVPARAGASFLVSSRRMCAGTAFSACSSASCAVTVYMDGALFYEAGTGAPPPDMSRVQIADLAGVEFYQSSASAPAEYGRPGQADCGILLLWTRS